MNDKDLEIMRFCIAKDYYIRRICEYQKQTSCNGHIEEEIVYDRRDFSCDYNNGFRCLSSKDNSELSKAFQDAVKVSDLFISEWKKSNS